MSDFEIVTIDPSEVLDRTLTAMEEYVGEALYPGCPRVSGGDPSCGKTIFRILKLSPRERG